MDSLRVQDDGLFAPDVRRWAETKYRLIALYDTLFSTGMKHKWDERVYIDLYAGAGYSHVQGTSIFLKGSPSIALTVPDPFDKYIFCEEDERLLDALSARTRRIAPAANVSLIKGRCDDNVQKILAEVPRPSAENRVLSLCLVDPFDFGMKFDTCEDCRLFLLTFWFF